MCKGYEKLVLITDSMEATGCEDGEYSLAGMKVYVKDSIALTEEGALAGSTLSMLDAVKNLARFAEIPFGDALLCATLTPAKAIGVDNSIGSIEQGKKADILFLSRDYDILKVMKSGKFYE